MDRNRVIGFKGKMPWHLPEDLRRFKQLTLNHAVIMGRKTFESIGKELVQRINIIVTHNNQYRPPGEHIIVAHGIDDIMKWSQTLFQEGFVIGGSQIYKLVLPYVDKLYLTMIDDTFEGDTFFPTIDLHKDFEVIEETSYQVSAQQNIRYKFVTAVRCT